MMIAAIILAAGNSIRMGVPKMTLRWGNTTVIGKVVMTIFEAGILEVIIVTGRYQSELIDVLKDYPVNYVYNPDFEQGEMLSSVKKGIASLGDICEAALIVLGDQPQIEPAVIRLLIDRYQNTKGKIIVPSYQMHKGHPWLIDKTLWHEILDLEPALTLKDYLTSRQRHVNYVDVDSPSILQDLDTPEDYEVYHP